MLKKIINHIEDWIDKKNIRTILLTALVFLYGFFCLLKMYYPQSANNGLKSVEFLENPLFSQVISDDVFLKSVDSVKSVIKPKPAKKNKSIKTDEIKYIEEILPTAKDESKKYRIPVSIKISQAIIESGFGTSSLAVEYNNHFGIKVKEDFTIAETEFVLNRAKHKTTEFFNNKKIDVVDEFYHYENRWASFRHHSLFLSGRIKNNPKYASMKNIPLKDYKKWAKALQKSGYSTSPKYAEKLIKIIEKYKLHQYDK